MTEHDIIQKASYLFQRYGIKSITMDAIARKLGIPKKTLYRYFANKENLLVSCITARTAKLYFNIQNIRQRETNPVLCLAKIWYLLLFERTHYYSVYFINLGKLPALFNKLQYFKHFVKEQQLLPLLAMAVQQKSIRPNLDGNLICQMLFLLIDNYFILKLKQRLNR